VARCDIIIPYFQSTPGVLNRTLSSVFRQTFKDYRVVVIDDGSPIPATEELKQTPEKFVERIHVIVQENAGVSSARNRGLDEVEDTEGFVAFLDSDDVWTPNHLANASNIYENTDADFFWDTVASGTGFERYRTPAELIPEEFVRRWPDNPSIYDVLDMRRAMFGQWWRFIHLSVTTISKQLSAKVRFNEAMNLGEDFDFLYSCAKLSQCAVFSNQTGMQRGLGDNIWHGVKMHEPAYIAERLTTIRLLKGILDEPGLSQGDKQLLSARIQIAREQLYWGLRAGMKHQSNLQADVIWNILIKDPGFAPVAAKYALRIRSADSRTIIQTDDL